MSVGTEIGHIITLNKDLVEIPRREPFALKSDCYRTPNIFADRFTHAVASRLTEKCRLDLIYYPPIDGVDAIQSGLLEYVSKAYSLHAPITIAPHDIYFLVLTQVATMIRKNPEQFRSLFTRSSEKVDIIIQTDDPANIDLEEIFGRLRGLVPVDVDTFVPAFSTHTEESRLACIASFADGLQHYYDYMTFCCGIPAVKVVGTQEDWQLLVDTLTKISDLMEPLKDWFLLRVIPRIRFIMRTFAGDTDVAEWMNIFTQRNIGSGGEVSINGWITDFYQEVPSLTKLENFPLALGVIPYSNLDTGRSFLGVHGAFLRRRHADGFTFMDYGHVTFEKMMLEAK